MADLTVRYVKMSDSFQPVHGGGLYQVDYGLANDGTEPVTGWWFERTEYGPDGSELRTTIAEGISELQPGQSVDWCWLSDHPAVLNTGWCRIHIRFYKDSTVAFEDDVWYEIVGDPATASTPASAGTLTVRYVKMSDTSQQVHGGSLYQVDYGLANDGTEPITGWWFERTEYGPDGSESRSTIAEGISELQPGQSVDWCWLSDHAALLNTGWCRIHIRFYNATTIAYEDDVWYEVQ